MLSTLYHFVLFYHFCILFVLFLSSLYHFFVVFTIIISFLCHLYHHYIIFYHHCIICVLYYFKIHCFCTRVSSRYIFFICFISVVIFVAKTNPSWFSLYLCLCLSAHFDSEKHCLFDLLTSEQMRKLECGFFLFLSLFSDGISVDITSFFQFVIWSLWAMIGQWHTKLYRINCEFLAFSVCDGHGFF